MEVIGKYKVKHLVVKLEIGIDIRKEDAEYLYWLNQPSYRVKQDKLNKIAKSIGYDSYKRCSNFTERDTYVTAEFIKRIEV